MSRVIGGNAIIKSIQERRLLKLHYPGRILIVEPHAYGLDHAGNTLLLCYERSECNTSSETTGWRQLNIRNSISAKETLEYFAGARPGYKRNDTGLVAVLAQI